MNYLRDKIVIANRKKGHGTMVDAMMSLVKQVVDYRKYDAEIIAMQVLSQQPNTRSVMIRVFRLRDRVKLP